MMVTDRNGNTVRYGRINTQMIARWAKLPPEDDGPFWALNLMKYRAVADYADGRAATKTGREADDEYIPRDALGGVGARIVFAAEVERITIGDGVEWDRVGIVRYPSRRAFLAMQQRDDFKQKHVHKDAGMESTIVISCLPVREFNGALERHPFVTLRVTGQDDPVADKGANFDVEGVIIGDERTWSRASFNWLDEDPGAPPRIDDPHTYEIVLRPSIDHLVRSVAEAHGGSIA